MFITKYKHKKQVAELKDEIDVLHNIMKLQEERSAEEKQQLESKLRKLTSSNGGYKTSVNSKKQKIVNLEHNIKQLSEEFLLKCSETEKMEQVILAYKTENKVLKDELTKLQGIADNLNKIISKKIRPMPTVTEITNYDKKYPIKK